MNARSTDHRCYRANHFKHGLTSRARAEEWFDDDKRMAEELIRGGPRTEEILAAARSLSGQFFLLQAIRKERRRLLTTPPPPDGYEEFSQDAKFKDIRYDILNSGFLQEAPDKPWARRLISYATYEDVVEAYVPTSEDAADVLRRRPEMFHRVDEYERRARSRILKLAIRLDHLILEERRKAATENDRSASRT